MNRTELQQVLVNLMVNAIHAMGKGGQMTLATEDALRDHESGVALCIADTGTGMAPEVRARVFDPFFTTRLGAGTGLGLSISRQLITRYGGSIEVESTPGKGTMFRLWLPVASALAA